MSEIIFSKKTSLLFSQYKVNLTSNFVDLIFQLFWDVLIEAIGKLYISYPTCKTSKMRYYIVSVLPKQKKKNDMIHIRRVLLMRFQCTFVLSSLLLLQGGDEFVMNYIYIYFIFSL